MHVTLVTSVASRAPAASGTRSYVLGLAERLTARGVEVVLVTRSDPAPVREGIKVLTIPGGKTSMRFLARLITSAPGLRLPPRSVIHAHRPDDMAAFVLAKRRNPKVVTLHGNPSRGVRDRRGAAIGFMYSRFEKVGLRDAHRVICVDRHTEIEYRTRYPWLADRMRVIPVAIDTTRFRALDREEGRARFGIQAEHAILFAGRLSREKRVASLLRALPPALDAELLIAGEGKDEPNLRQLARDRRVRFLGSVSHDEMPLLMSAADVLVLLSAYEGTPTVVLEALACGTPVIATAVGSLPDLIQPGRTGWFVDGSEGLPDVLRASLPRARAMREACVEAARPYDWDASIDRIVGVYREAEALA